MRVRLEPVVEPYSVRNSISLHDTHDGLSMVSILIATSPPGSSTPISSTSNISLSELASARGWYLARCRSLFGRAACDEQKGNEIAPGPHRQPNYAATPGSPPFSSHLGGRIVVVMDSDSRRRALRKG